MVPFLLVVCLIGILSGDVNGTHFDPVNDYCRRFSHQTALLDRRLYIDGGYVNYGMNVYPDTKNQTNTYLLFVNLNELQNGYPLPYANLSKPSYVPSVAGGILWPDTVNKILYLYGGEYNWTADPPSRPALWYYDVRQDQWDSRPIDSGISPTSYGASVVDDHNAVAYAYGGWMSNTTMLDASGYPAAQSGLIIYDMVKNSWKNVSFYDETPRAEGTMFYIPASDAGILIYLGGVYQQPDMKHLPTSMNEIFIYDIASQESFLQRTNGDHPDYRRKFCGSVVWPDDQSSYNIYIYGGLPSPEQQGVGYSTLWVLSLPSFTWTEIRSNESNPRHSMSCNLVDQSQMIVVGGAYPDEQFTGCDARPVFGQHSLNLNGDDGQEQWDEYHTSSTSYQVPEALYTVIGGGPNGGATKTAPADGWVTPDLANIFGRTYKPSASRAATGHATGLPTNPAEPSPANKSQSRVGSILGGVIGGVLTLVLLVIAVRCFRRYRRKELSARARNQIPRHDEPAVDSNTQLLAQVPIPPPARQSEWTYANHRYQGNVPRNDVGSHIRNSSNQSWVQEPRSNLGSAEWAPMLVYDGSDYDNPYLDRNNHSSLYLNR